LNGKFFDVPPFDDRPAQFFCKARYVIYIAKGYLTPVRSYMSRREWTDDRDPMGQETEVYIIYIGPKVSTVRMYPRAYEDDVVT